MKTEEEIKDKIKYFKSAIQIAIKKKAYHIANYAQDKIEALEWVLEDNQ